MRIIFLCTALISFAVCLLTDESTNETWYVIQPVNGLGNRLRTIFSYNQYAESLQMKLMVYWNISSACNGYFLDYFLPIPNIIFLRNYSNKSNIDYRGFHGHINYPPDYSLLRLKPELISHLHQRLYHLSYNYTAVHIRRTDHTQLLQSSIKTKQTPDWKFVEFIESSLLVNSSQSFLSSSFSSISSELSIFIATDNRETQDYFYGRFYFNNIIIFNWIERPEVIPPPPSIIYGINKHKDSKYAQYYRDKYFPRPQTPDELMNRSLSLHDTVLDMFTCVLANSFMGSKYSSFSDVIFSLRSNFLKNSSFLINFMSSFID